MRIFYLFTLSLRLHFYILNISPFIVHAKRPFMHPLPPFLMNIVLSKQHSDPFTFFFTKKIFRNIESGNI